MDLQMGSFDFQEYLNIIICYQNNMDMSRYTRLINTVHALQTILMVASVEVCFVICHPKQLSTAQHAGPFSDIIS